MKTKSLEIALEKLWNKLQFWFENGIENIPNIILAAIVLLLFTIAVKIFKKLGEKGLRRLSDNVNIIKLIIQFVSFFVMTIGFFMALGILHLDKTVTSLLAGVGILGLAFSFAFQHTAANILSGILISFKSNIRVGDLIQTNDHFGNVLEVGLRATKIINVRGQHVAIPNRLVLDNPIIEFSQTKFRRIDVTGKLNLTEDLTSIKNSIEEDLCELEFIYLEKLPNMVYNELDFEKVNFTLRVWMNFSENDGEFVNARSKCIETLSRILIAHNVQIPVKEFTVSQ